MNQTITNLNNLDLLTKSQSSSPETITKISDSMDKTADTKGFDKIFKKQLDKEDKTLTKQSTEKTSENSLETSNNSEVVAIDSETSNIKTLGELKNTKTDNSNNTLWGKFKEVLAEVTSEVNVQTSLDLTLTKDINETITQLKENFISNTETEDSEEINLEAETLENIVIIEENLLTEDDNFEETEEIQNETCVEIDSNKDQPVIFEQILSSINSNTKETNKVNINLETKTNIDENSIDFQQNNEALSTLTEEVAQTSEKNATKTDEQIIDENMLEDLNLESIEVETDTNTENQDSLLEHQTPEEQGIKAQLQKDFESIENFDLKIEKTLNTQTVQQSANKPIDINPSKILDQISKQMEGLQNSSKVNIVLNPESLGKVSIQLIKTGEGLSAQFTVNSQEIKDMLMKGLESLKETLLSQGVGVDNISVKINDTQKSEYNNDWTEQEGSRGGNKEQKESQKEKEEGLFEKMIAQASDNKDENGKV